MNKSCVCNLKISLYHLSFNTNLWYAKLIHDVREVAVSDGKDVIIKVHVKTDCSHPWKPLKHYITQESRSDIFEDNTVRRTLQTSTFLAQTAVDQERRELNEKRGKSVVLTSCLTLICKTTSHLKSCPRTSLRSVI